MYILRSCNKYIPGILEASYVLFRITPPHPVIITILNFVRSLLFSLACAMLVSSNYIFFNWLWFWTLYILSHTICIILPFFQPKLCFWNVVPCLHATVFHSFLLLYSIQFCEYTKSYLSVSFSGRLCYLAANSLTFCLSKYIIISPSFLKNIYTWYMILGWQFHCLPVPFANVAKSGLSLIAVGELSFPLDAFFFFFSFNLFIYGCVGSSFLCKGRETTFALGEYCNSQAMGRGA